MYPRPERVKKHSKITNIHPTMPLSNKWNSNKLHLSQMVHFYKWQDYVGKTTIHALHSYRGKILRHQNSFLHYVFEEFMVLQSHGSGLVLNRTREKNISLALVHYYLLIKNVPENLII